MAVMILKDGLNAAHWLDARLQATLRHAEAAFGYIAARAGQTLSTQPGSMPLLPA